jgi:hypothetical protein
VKLPRYIAKLATNDFHSAGAAVRPLRSGFPPDDIPCDVSRSAERRVGTRIPENSSCAHVYTDHCFAARDGTTIYSRDRSVIEAN